MHILHWLKGRFSDRGKALSLYRRGMTRANKHDHQGAIEDYTATINLSATPPDVRAMALYNRALVHDAIKADPQALADLQALLAMDEAHTDVKTMARQKLVRIERRANRSNEQKANS